MAVLPLEEAIPRFKSNEDRIDVFVNGDETASYTTSNGVQVPSLRKLKKQVDDLTDALTDAVTVSALPAAATAGAGSRMFVTDATATTFASIVSGGGANGVPVYSDGTNWRIG